MNIAVAGTGYVGLVTGVCLAEIGHFVTCVDVDKIKIEMLKSGKIPIYEPELEELIERNRSRLEFTTQYAGAYRNADVIFIGVGTPERRDGSANLQYVFEVSQQIAESVERDCLVVVKSTVPIGTNDKVEKILTENLKSGVRIELASNPEFLSQGSAVHDTLHASRIVLGVESKAAEVILKNVYDGFGQPYVIVDRKSAEMIKYASNDFLALKISYINEIANLCEIVGANIEDVARGMGMDPRIGDKFLRAGIGYGGSCFPKDTKALHWLANFNDYELKTVKATIEVNEQQKMKLIKKARKYYESFEGLTVAILGLTFKPGTDDLRDAPSLQNVPILLEDGACIKAWDPAGTNNFRKYYPNELRYCDTIDETIQDADLCFIFTEWPEVLMYDLMQFERLMRAPLVIDGRNCFKPDLVMETGMIYESIGRKIIGDFSATLADEVAAAHA